MPQVDPKATFWFGVWTNVLMLIASYGIDHAPPLIAQFAPTVQWLAGFSYKINSVVLTALVGLSSNNIGPLIRLPDPPNFTPTVLKVLIAAFVLSMFLAGGAGQAQAAGLKAPQITGDVVADAKANLGIGSAGAASTPASLGIDPEALIKKIIAVAQPDLQYAVAMATYAGTGSSKVRLQCWSAISDFNAKATGANLVDAKGVALVTPASGQDIFTNLERIAEGIDSLSPTGPLFTSCAGAAALAGTNVLAFINGLVAAVAIAPK
jgi:hypothetical protein